MALESEAAVARAAIPGAGQPHVMPAVMLMALARGEYPPQAARALGWWQRLLLILARLCRVTRHAPLTRYLSRYWLPRGRQVCVIGGDSAGLGVAQLLCGYGRKVSIVETGPEFGVDMVAGERTAILDHLQSASAVMINHSRVRRIDVGTLVLDCDGAEIDIPADLVLLQAAGR